MGKYEQVSKLSNEQFRRLTGVKRETFKVMIEVLELAEKAVRQKGGAVPKLCMEDRLLLCLEYLREYRTYLHIGISYGVSESQAFRIQRWVETEILKDEQFHLPGRKQLLDPDYEIETILTDASEIPVERPKKTQE